jgi:hypothetical protein
VVKAFLVAAIPEVEASLAVVIQAVEVSNERVESSSRQNNLQLLKLGEQNEVVLGPGLFWSLLIH